MRGSQACICVEKKSSQAHVWVERWSCSNSCRCLNVTLKSVCWRVTWPLCLAQNATFVLHHWWSPTLAFVWKRDPRISMRPAFEALSSVIFRQPIEPLPRFLKSHGWLRRILKYFGLHLDLGLHDWSSNLLKYPELDPVWILVFMSILLNCLKPQGRSL